jgi:hypothetical protein
MEDRRVGILETEESISGFEEELALLEDQIREFPDEVSVLRFLFASFLLD